ncbi:unnamed protein product [Peronospora belbahrii]|uniref:START domain-containing protein n=1 Tax=Peronospora belbahrii TaxID=622444 RepID=A0AAU9LFY8_9STRA|nr:unnamed protein product [Peronospora belbahrii]
MVKGRFIMNPFTELALSGNDHSQLETLAKTLIMSNLEKYLAYQDEKIKGVVDPLRWKLYKQHQGVTIYVERPGCTSCSEHVSGNDLPLIRGIGNVEGKLDDLMYGLVSPTLEMMRVKASYVEDFSGAAVLDSIVEPSLEDPFQALVVKWMEIDIPFASTSLVKNRDYVYIDATGFVRTKNGERLAYHLMHSVNFPKTPDLPNRIRGKLSSVAFWRQTGPNAIEFFGTAVMDPVGAMTKLIAVPTIGGLFFSTLKYAFCGQMKKLTFMLDKKYAESKLQGIPQRKNVCVTCSSPMTGRRLGNFGKSNHTCKLCCGFRKVTFCASCISESTRMSSSTTARTQLVASGTNIQGQTNSRMHLFDLSDSIHSNSIVYEY